MLAEEEIKIETESHPEINAQVVKIGRKCVAESELNSSNYVVYVCRQ